MKVAEFSNLSVPAMMNSSRSHVPQWDPENLQSLSPIRRRQQIPFGSSADSKTVAAFP